MQGSLVTVLVLALATGAIAYTFSKSHLGEWLSAYFYPRSTLLGQLFSCPYCLSHWVALGLVAAYQPRLVQAWLPLDLCVSLFAIVALAEFAYGVIYYFMSAAYSAEDLRDKIKQLKEAKDD